MRPSIQELLDQSRNELLDLSTRNRLLSIPVDSKSAKIVQVHDELSDQVYRLLVAEKKQFSFLAGRSSSTSSAPARSTLEEADDEIGLPPPDDKEDDATGLAKRHVDSKLQTALSPEGLQRRLLDLYRDARTMIEEQGVNILYLVLGHLKWFEAEQSAMPRYAPLILIPVALERKSASERIVLKWTEEDIEENLSIRAKLKLEFGIELPDFGDEEDLNPGKYFRGVAQAVSGEKGWEVIPNAITLGFFSFAKFLMYRDLDAENWPEADDLVAQPFISALLADGFPPSEPLLTDDVHLDEIIPAAKLDHVVDADSSQALAIEAVRQGRSMVIQGPPGTGKSQSITNVIATALLDGKKVLFVAEKLAALEVVKRRLVREGLGDVCLELHSNKSNKRAVIEEIGRTWKLGKPKASDLENSVPKLENRRSHLNKHVDSLHEPHPASGLSPFGLMGQLVVLGDKGRSAGECTFADAQMWTADHRGEHRRLIEELASRVEQIGLPTQHPWRGVGREAILAIDIEPLLTRIRSVPDKLVELRQTCSSLASALSQPTPSTFVEVEQQRIVAECVAQAPTVDKQALCNGVWNAGLDGLRDLLSEGRNYSNATNALGKMVVDSVWEKDFTQTREQIAAHGKSLFRFLNSSYRAAIAEVRGVIKGELPKSYADRLALLDQTLSGQQALRRIRADDALGQSAFGSLWRKEKTDWGQLEVVVVWVTQQNEAGLGASFRKLFSHVSDQPNISALVQKLGTEFISTREQVWRLFQELELNCPVAFGVHDFDHASIVGVVDRCRLWLENGESLMRWSAYHCRAHHARSVGLSPLIDGLESGKVPTKGIVDCFDRIYFSQLLRELVRQKPQLAQFDGELHTRHVEEFKQLDTQRLALSKHRALLAHFSHMPQFNVGVGAAGILMGEMEKKRGHRSVRRLLKDSGSVVQAIKPVFMMSPLSVAQFLEPGAVEFDLLVIDEASQVQPVDALGAIARCKQIVVVGDSKQLPPTKFFARITSNTSEAEDSESEEPQVAQAQDVESILGLCRARGLPEKMLRWHYRSRHHSLIAVSNHEFYEDKLFIVPSPFSSSAQLGLKFNHVPDGVFDRGRSGTNRIEAKAICKAIIEHARNNPKESLGVAAFSVRQQQAIHDELELLRRENPDAEAFFADHSSEPFFVKNLENVQGDERDVMFISVGYSKDENGYMAMSFGPLNMEGGERRLNVLISRAKKRCEVFSSITADDIDLERAPRRGVASFKAFLSFAQTGRLSVAQQSGRDEDSPFEEAVRRAIESLGYEVHAQVGIAGFFIDLAVLDREKQGRYLVGIECDGAAYHSSRSARDRDRLRQAVLEDHGWIIHRIWSTDWFQRPAEQLRKTEEAIKRAKVIFDERSEHQTPKVSATFTVSTNDAVERESVLHLSNAGLNTLATPYKEAKFEVPRRTEPHELSTKDFADILLKIVQQEGPIHEDEVVNRVRDLWGFARAGGRIQDAVAKSVRSLLVTKRCTREEGFLAVPDAAVPIRTREAVNSSSLRKPEMLPLAEIRAAILAVIDAGHGATKEEIPVAVARLFGFKNTSAQLRSVIESQMGKLICQASVVETNGMLNRAEQPSAN